MLKPASSSISSSLPSSLPLSSQSVRFFMADDKICKKRTNLLTQKINLTDRESFIFDTLLKSLHARNKNTIPRVAGGWVRDKLLNRESDDIDIALDDQTGVEFANGVNQYLISTGKRTRSVAVIQANPEQSKHLETANIAIMDFDIDCVNLRAETYTEHSRIPEIRFGTPLEDALRRDFTINALFYNLKTESVEDFTEKGIEDLEFGIIRTPLPPMATFTDDPLRVLRAVRFASRYNFQLAEDLIIAACDRTIHHAIIHKVSRERVFKEFAGMMNSKGHPYIACLILYRLNLLDTILLVNSYSDKLQFTLDVIRYPRLQSKLYEIGTLSTPSTTTNGSNSIINAIFIWEKVSMETTAWLTILLAIQKQNRWNLTQSEEYIHLLNDLTLDVHDNHLFIHQHEITDITGGTRISELYYSSICAGVRSFFTTDKKGKMSPFVTTLRESLKMDTETMRVIHIITDNLSLCNEYSINHINLTNDLKTIECIREEAGLFIRQCKEYWIDTLLVACAYELAIEAITREHTNKVDFMNRNIDRASYPSSTILDHDYSQSHVNVTIETLKRLLHIDDVEVQPWAKAIIKRYQCLQYLWANILHLDKAYELKPLLDGTEMMNILPLMKKGRQVGIVMEEQIKWQLRYPQGTREELIPYLQEYLLKLNG